MLFEPKPGRWNSSSILQEQKKMSRRMDYVTAGFKVYQKLLRLQHRAGTVMTDEGEKGDSAFKINRGLSVLGHAPIR